MQALITIGQQLVAELKEKEGFASFKTTLNGKPLVIFAARGQGPCEVLTGTVAEMQRVLESQGIKTKAV
jgi:hypothetical protein